MPSSSFAAPHAAPCRAGPHRRAASAPEPSIPTLIPARALSLIRHRGGGAGADALIRDFDLPRNVEREPLLVLPISRIHRFLEAAERASGDPFLGIHMAEHGRADFLSTLAFVCRGVPDGQAVIERFLRYYTSVHSDLELTTTPTDTGFVLRQRIAGHPDCLGRHGNELSIAAMWLAAREIFESPPTPERVWLAHGAARSRDRLVRILGTSRISFGAGYNGIAMGRELLTTRVRSAEAPLDRILDRHAASIPPASPSATGFHRSVRDAMERALPGGTPTIAAVARALGVSARTLQRRLAEEERTFQDVLDTLRRDLAIPQVRRGELSLEEIAASLGYAQPSAFFRAFRRWTGTTPRRVRRGGAGAAD